MTGALIEFIFNVEPLSIDDDGTPAGKKKAQRASRPVRERLGTQSLIAAWAATGVLLAIVCWSYFYFAPLTYGKPGLTVDEVLSRKWLNYDFHFAK